MQVSFLNQALSRFNSTIVIPVNFVMFTTSTLVGSAILYRDFDHMSQLGSILSVIGISIMFFGVYLITLPKSVKLSQNIDDDLDLEIDRTDTPQEQVGLFPQGGLGFSSPMKLTFSMPQGVSVPQRLKRHSSFQFQAKSNNLMGSSITSERPASTLGHPFTTRSFTGNHKV